MLKQVLVGVSLLCAAGFSHAGFVTQNFTINEQVTDFTETVMFNLFDDQNGTRELLSVQFSLTAQTNGLAKAENLSGKITTVTATLDTEIALIDAMSNVVAISSPSIVKTAILQEYDGLTDFAGDSGIEFTGFDTNVMTNGSVTNANDLLAFIGMGNGSIVFSAKAMSIVSSNGNFTSEVSTKASGSASIIFEYKDELETSVVSAPSQLALFGLSLLGIFGVRKVRG